MASKIGVALILGLTLLLAGALAAQQKPEDIPDAPSATRPIPPPAQPNPRPGADDETLPDTPPQDNSGAGVTTGSKELPRSAPDLAGVRAGEKPVSGRMTPVERVPTGAVPKDFESGDHVYQRRLGRY